MEIETEWGWPTIVLLGIIALLVIVVIIQGCYINSNVNSLRGELKEGERRKRERRVERAEDQIDEIHHYHHGKRGRF